MTKPRQPLPRRRPDPGAARPLTLVLAISAASHADVKDLCARARALLERSGARVLVCDVSRIRRPDVGTVGALARLQLLARRLGRELTLRDPCRDLQRLLHLTGLADTLPLEGRLRRQPDRQAEEREQLRGVQEGVHRDDLSP